ncbi:hypothetical protein RNZ50_12320 [Paracoccaceae bacterium Fryx2]|nr:hypothetical protein [Paracoccaceae bacterium Fryx2]
MSLVAYSGAVLAMLLAPGPTNTLMGVAGAQGGPGRVMRLLPAELLGYLTTILPLVYLGAQILSQWPSVAVVLKLAAAAWVMFLAVRLWGRPGDGDGVHEVTARRVYLTTVLNPKALVFGLVLLPAPDAQQFGVKLGLFGLMVIVVAVIWGMSGVLTRIGGGGSRRLVLIKRVASVWLAMVSVTLLAGVIRA